MEKQNEKNTAMKGYDKSGRNFQMTDEDLREDKTESGKLQPEKYPVNDNRSTDTSGNKWPKDDTKTK
jgi:hypothetical protein